MKTNYIKQAIWATLFLMATVAQAQTTAGAKMANNIHIRNNFDEVHNENGKRYEWMQMVSGNKEYKAELVDDKLTALFIDGEKIPEADWGKYNDVITAIHEQIKANKIQEEKNRQQAVRNQEQARLNEIQAGKNREQAERNKEQARLNEIQEGKNRDQEKLNEIQAKKNEEQARLNEIQVEKNKGQVKKNEEQALRNQEQAKRNQEIVEENQRMMKQITADLVSDKIIADENSLHELKFDEQGTMTVNRVKQPDEVSKRYRQKYRRFASGSFSFSNDGIIQGN